MRRPLPDLQQTLVWCTLIAIGKISAEANVLVNFVVCRRGRNTGIDLAGCPPTHLVLQGREATKYLKLCHSRTRVFRFESCIKIDFQRIKKLMKGDKKDKRT